MSSELGPSCNDYSVEHVSFSDRCLVAVRVDGKKQSKAKFNWALWKLNEKLLKDDQFLSMIEEKRDELFQAECENRVEKCECFKQEVKILAIELSTEIWHDERKQEKGLRSLLKQLTLEETKTPGLFTADMHSVKEKIEAIEV